MGHERLGTLPRTQPWRLVVSQLHQANDSRDNLAAVASRTLENVRSRYLRIHEDSGVQAAFTYLLVLSSRDDVRSNAPHGTLPEANLEDNPSPLKIAASLQRWVSANSDSAEYGELARKAATDAIVLWTAKQAAQPNLFGSGGSAVDIWTGARSAAGFCEVSRMFFAKFTERYLNYFLERAAAAVFTSIDERQSFADGLRTHIDSVSRHAFETSKITQSFAAGWYNNHVRMAVPSNREVEQFLSTAFGKIREELLRESAR